MSARFAFYRRNVFRDSAPINSIGFAAFRQVILLMASSGVLVTVWCCFIEMAYPQALHFAAVTVGGIFSELIAYDFLQFGHETFV